MCVDTRTDLLGNLFVYLYCICIYADILLVPGGSGGSGGSEGCTTDCYSDSLLACRVYTATCAMIFQRRFGQSCGTTMHPGPGAVGVSVCLE